MTSATRFGRHAAELRLRNGCFQVLQQLANEPLGRLPFLACLHTGLVPGSFPGRVLFHLPCKCVLASPQALFAAAECLRHIFPLPLQYGALRLNAAFEFQ